MCACYLLPRRPSPVDSSSSCYSPARSAWSTLPVEVLISASLVLVGCPQYPRISEGPRTYNSPTSPDPDNSRAVCGGSDSLLALWAAADTRATTTPGRPCNRADQGGRPRRLCLVRRDHGSTAVPHDRAEPPHGCLRGQRHIAGPGLQRPVHTDDRGGRLGSEDPHLVAGHHSQAQQRPGHLTQPVQREIHTVPPPANPASQPAVAGLRNGPPSQEPAAMAAREPSAARRASPQTEALRREPSNDQHRAGIRAASASPSVMNSSPGTSRGRASLAPSRLTEAVVCTYGSYVPLEWLSGDRCK